MTGSNVVLDTNIIIEIFNGNQKIADAIRKNSNIFIPSIVVGELYVGVNRVTNKSKHLKLIDDFLLLSTVLLVNEDTGKFYGKIVAELFKKGKPIPTNDVWIAATVMQNNYTLATNDKHFKQIEKLKCLFL